MRSQSLVASLVKDGTLSGTLRIPNTVGPITVTADLRAGRITTSVDVEAPKNGRPQTRINWLLRQLKDAPDALRVDCWAAHARGASTSELLKAARENANCLSTTPRRICARSASRSPLRWVRNGVRVAGPS